ncbi:MAG: zinc ribbon domain-containing protein, partial [Tissierellia bacterium]|nr:zinc ribbon domain-containing protein [Tissierellia bacterium]
MFCNKCGTKLKKNSNFCHVCGNKVSEVEIYIRKSDEPIPDQISMGEMFEKPEFKKIEQRDSGFLDILRSFRIKDDKPHTPLEGDNEVALKFNKKVEIKSEEEIKLDSKEDKPTISQKSKTKSKDFKEFDIPKFQVGKDTKSEKLEFKEEDLLLPIEDIP